MTRRQPRLSLFLSSGRETHSFTRFAARYNLINQASGTREVERLKSNLPLPPSRCLSEDERTSPTCDTGGCRRIASRVARVPIRKSSALRYFVQHSNEVEGDRARNKDNCNLIRRSSDRGHKVRRKEDNLSQPEKSLIKLCARVQL